MLNWIIEASLRHRKLVLVIAALVAALGFYSVQQLSIDAFPDVTDVMVQINTVAPALGPAEVEQQISAKVEQVMGGLPKLKLVRSMSKFGLSQVTLVFDDGTDIYFARAQVLERLQGVELPAGLARPTMGPVATGLGEIYHYIITAPGGDLTDTRTLHDWVVKPQLLAVKGVAEVNSWGGLEMQFQIVIDPIRLVKHGLTARDVVEAVERSNANVGGGLARASGEDLLIHGIGVVTNESEIGAITIRSVDGRAIRIRDVADVVRGHETRRGVVTADGTGEVVLGLGFMLMGENSHIVAGRLHEKMDEIKKSLPEGTKIDVVYDRTDLVDHVIGTVKRNLFEGALLVIAVLFVFLGHFRASLIVAAAIPLSMLFAFSLMVRAGIAGTLMSLGALDFGLIVDSSVIMIENSVRHLGHAPKGRSVTEIVAEASKEVRKPTMFGELIIMIVYLPILALEGVEGKLFKPMALTVVFALLGSMFFSLTLMPVLASLLLGRGERAHREPWVVRLLKWLYRPLVRFTVSHPLVTIGAAIIAVAGTVPIGLSLGSVFVPKLDEGSIVINTVRFPGVSVDESVRVGTQIERLLLAKFPDEVSRIWSRTGTPEVATDPMGLEVSDVFVMLNPSERWKVAHTREDLEARMRDLLKSMPGMAFSFTQPIEMRFNEMISGVRTDVGVKVFGDDYDQLKEHATNVQKILAGVRGAAEPAVEAVAGQPVLQVRLDQEALSRYGLQARDVLDLVEAAGGREVGEIRTGQQRFPLSIRLPDRYIGNADLFSTLLVPAPDGQRLPLKTLAKVERVTGPLVINREWGKRRVVVTTNVVDRDLGSFVAEAADKIEEKMGADLRKTSCRIEFGGQYENLVRASKTLSYVVPFALLLILILVYSTYGNVRDSLRVFTGVPFSLVGGVLALHFRHMPLSISAGVGFIALAGVSVLADMVMVSTIRQILGQGVPVRQAVLAAAEQRLRPVMMTALVASLGFIPMAFNTGVGAEVQRPLATVVIGGLISSTILTLFVLPTLFAALRFGSRRAKPTNSDAAAASKGA
jgi:cobalt-zinc-cadmium resistance protein CzcA